MTRIRDVARHIAPALALLVLAPLIGEFLLGDFNIRQIGFVLVFIPIYGTGALLVREIARRTGRGWPTMLLLSLAYALMLEGFVNQTLFNPNYAGQRLLDFGFIPALGTSLNFAVYVLTLHVVWSLGSAIAVAESLAGPRWNDTWLGRAGLVVAALLTVLGCLATVSFTLKTFHFVASASQFASVAVLVMLAIVVAIRGFRPAARADAASIADDGIVQARPAPSTWQVLTASLVLTSAFHVWFVYAPRFGAQAALALAGLLAIEAGAVLLFGWWSERRGWGPAHALAAAAGAIVTYGWLSILRFVIAGGTSLGVPATPVDIAGQAGLLLALLALCVVGMRRVRGLR